MQWFQPIQQCDRCQAGSGTMQAQCTLAYMPQAGEATMCSGSSPVNVVNVAVLQQACNMSYMGHMCKMRPEPQNYLRTFPEIQLWSEIRLGGPK